MTTTPQTYRKTATIQALQFTTENLAACRAFAGDKLVESPNGMIWYIQTLEGPLPIHLQDWIAQGVEGEFWPIAESVFAKSYVLDLGADPAEPIEVAAPIVPTGTQL